VTIYEIAEWQGIVFIAMEYIEGTDLRRRFRNGPPEVNEAMQVMLEISGALGAAHDMGIVHLDLKPENVLVRTAGGIKIVDFGCARFLEPQEPPGRALEEGGRGLKARISSVLGTPLYMAPEQIRGAGLDCRADIYSFGVLAYELLTGAPPFAGNDTFSLIHSILTETPRAPSSLNRSVPLSLDRTILKALEKDPTERFSSMAELERSLRKHGKKATQNV
jgi:serine/threonine-protein kinase